MDTKIKILVTLEKFDEVFSIDDWFNFGTLSQAEVYKKMLLFVVDADDKYVDVETARSLFKEVKKSEWIKYLAEFMEAIDKAFVNPTSGG